jgi:hypothetical protein
VQVENDNTGQTFFLVDDSNMLHHESIPTGQGPALVAKVSMTASIAYVSLKEEATLALQGAAARLAKANSHLSDFLTEHGSMDAFGTAATPSLMREYHGLLIERDDAIRQHNKAQFDLSQIQERGRR